MSSTPAAQPLPGAALVIEVDVLVAMFENSPDAVLLLDMTGTILHVNSEGYRMFGYDRPELLGTSVDVLVPEGVRKRHHDRMQEYLLNPRPLSLGANLQVHALTRTQEQFPVHISLTPMQTSRGPLLVAGIRDLTEQLSVLRQLNEQEALADLTLQMQQQAGMLLEILGSIGDPVVAADSDGEVFFTNKAAHQLFYSQGDDAMDQEWLHPSRIFIDEGMTQLPQGQTPMRKVLAGQVVDQQEIYLRLPEDRGSVWLSITGRPLPQSEGWSGGAVFVMRDVTEQKRAAAEIADLNRQLRNQTDELQSSNRELSLFSYAVSHDLRGPMRSINGFADLLSERVDDGSPEQIKDHLQRIKRATGRMSSLLSGLESLAAINQQELEPRAVMLSFVVESIVEELRQVHPERQVSVTIDPEMVVWGDEVLLRIALENLLRNAWKFTDGTDGATIEVGQLHDSIPAAIYVRDNGVGFDMAYSDKLFRPFQRLHTPKEFDGTGIGLAIVRRVVERHGGRAWAEAAPGEGATFFLTLPTRFGGQLEGPGVASSHE